MANIQINDLNSLSNLEGNENLILQTTSGLTVNTSINNLFSI